jgi:hypothetical protein
VIKAGDKFDTGGAVIQVHEISSYDVKLGISNTHGKSAYFGSQNIKELRKFLKKLQKQLESNSTGL